MEATNKQVVQRFEKAFTANDLETVDEVCAPNLVDHNPAPGFEPNLDGFKQAIGSYYSAMGGSGKQELIQILAEGDLVSTLWVVTGTHKGELFGIPASNKEVRVEGMNFYRLAGGKITEVWTQFDGLGMMQQIGAIPQG